MSHYSWEFQSALNSLNQSRLCPAMPTAQWREAIQYNHDMSLLEGEFLESERAAVAMQAARAPCNPEGFARWFDALNDHGPGQHDPLFDHLAEHATLDELRWFLRQEVAGEAGFEDLVALSQLRLPEQAKLELARNYWDEMGHGKSRAMHGPMLASMAEALDIQGGCTPEIVWESLALCNVLAGLACNRRFAYHSLGALGVIELTAPSRAVKVTQALDRLGVARSVSRYFRVHAAVDIAHAKTWRDEVLVPIVARHPEAAVCLAEGALMRLNCGARTFERYRIELGLTPRYRNAA